MLTSGLIGSDDGNKQVTPVKEFGNTKKKVAEFISYIVAQTQRPTQQKLHRSMPRGLLAP